MTQYEPELGQMLFGQPGAALSVPVEVESAMLCLHYAFDTLYPGKGNPFSNTGARLKWSCFEVHAYDWCDEREQEFNFKWRDFIVCWYKYNGRGMSRNRKIKPAELREMLAECLKAMVDEQPVDLWA